VVEKPDAVFRQRFTGAIEYRRRLAASFLVERIVVRNPRATGVIQAEQFRLAHDVVDMVATLFV
jgi:hypothetical protein